MIRHDSLYYPYTSRRHSLFSTNGMVATSQPLAAAAGLSVLREGGNAIDAAIATAACLTVLEPTSNGNRRGCFRFDMVQRQASRVERKRTLTVNNRH